MKDNRPVNLHVTPSALPITAYISFFHRISGVVLYAGIAVLLWGLQASLQSEQSFADLKETLSNPVCQFIVWATVAALAYHLVAGIKHLIMDMGIGESLQGGKIGSILVIIVAAILIALAGVWIW
ncbi:succinate dehydrogenase, cytochrome b556 subunit [Aurantivibrio infirmus]